MRAPALPEDEESRLEALYACRALDTDPEPAFDGITTLAAAVMETPIALVTLVDRTRQWFKSSLGLDARETPRELSFCGHVVAGRRPLVVDDTLADERFFDNPFVLGAPRVRFYAGVPLKSRDGHVLGTLCVVDVVPRTMTDDRVALLGLLAAQVEAQLESRRKDALLAIEQRRVHELNQGSETLLECLREAVVVHDARGVIVRANASARRLFKREILSDITGRSTLDELFRCVTADGTPFPRARMPSVVARETMRPAVDVIGLEQEDETIVFLDVRAYPAVVDGAVDTTIVTLAVVG